jgi:hypothetical protein
MAVWNANGLANHYQEVKSFLVNQQIDIMLVSETHFTNRNSFRIPYYTVYDTQHPNGTARGGTAVIIKTSIRHHEINKCNEHYLQATSVVIEDWTGPITISAVYCPPNKIIKQTEFEKFYSTLGSRFIVGGDYNAKHPQWGSRLTTPKGRELFKTMTANNMYSLSTGEPTYWPTDRRKIPDVLDFCVIKGINENYVMVQSCFDLSSDHSPIIITLNAQISRKKKPPTLCNHKTDWVAFQEILDTDINCSIPLKSEHDIDTAIENICQNIQKAAWNSTPEQNESKKASYCPLLVRQQIAEKRKLRRQWQYTRSPVDKNKLNRATKNLKNTLDGLRNQNIHDYLENLSATEASDYSLWKATQKLKHPQTRIPPIKKADGSWARSAKEKAQAFAEHLVTVFQPFPSESPAEDEIKIHEFLDAPFQMDFPIRKIKCTEVKEIIQNNVNTKKSPGFDLISGRVLKELPNKCIRLITIVFNALIRLSYFPDLWKVAQIILIPKPGQQTDIVQSYRPISLLPILSKVFEKLILKRLQPTLNQNGLIPDHQFGFRRQHGTIEQIHRIVSKINSDLEEQRYCSAAFLDISQAFDKVWHTGLLYKLKEKLPYHFYTLLRSYLTNRSFMVKHEEEQTPLFPIQAGVPQGSVLGPVLYTLYTADQPITEQTTTATYADDTAALASHEDPAIASKNLQTHLDKLQIWFKKWRIKVNEKKSVHVTFTMRKQTCPSVFLNNEPLPQSDHAKYLGMHLDRKLNWKKHILTKRTQLDLKFRKLYWIIGRQSNLSMENKLLLYKSILKPVWTYGIQLWGSAAKSNIDIIQRFQSKILRCITGAPWYVPNNVIQRDLHMVSVKEEISKYSVKYHNRLSHHPNKLAMNLLNTEADVRRLGRFHPTDLPKRFSNP